MITEDVKLKRWQVYLSIFMATVALLGNITLAVAWKTETDIAVTDHKKRIVTVEGNEVSNREILLELQYNLQNLMAAQGVQYIKLNK